MGVPSGVGRAREITKVRREAICLMGSVIWNRRRKNKIEET